MTALDAETCAASERKAPLEFAKASPWPPASLARPSISFRFLFGRLLRLHGPRCLFAFFSAASFACTALVILSLSFRTSWALLGHFLPLLGLSWPLLGRSWPLLGSSWAALGRSWEALGELLAALGRSWGDLGTTCKNHEKNDAKNDRFGLPKAPPNGTKIAPKSDQKSMQKTKRKKNRNKIVLGPSWDDLGSCSVAPGGQKC